MTVCCKASLENPIHKTIIPMLSCPIVVMLLFRHQGDTVVNILIDLNGFWSYENREVLVADQGDGDSSESHT